VPTSPTTLYLGQKTEDSCCPACKGRSELLLASPSLPASLLALHLLSASVVEAHQHQEGREQLVELLVVDTKVPLEW